MRTSLACGGGAARVFTPPPVTVDFYRCRNIIPLWDRIDVHIQAQLPVRDFRGGAPSAPSTSVREQVASTTKE